MFVDSESLILLIVFLVIGVVLLVCCVYCCACKPGCVNARRRLIRGQLTRDEEVIDEERQAHRTQLREQLNINEQTRNDVRTKYQLREKK